MSLGVCHDHVMTILMSAIVGSHLYGLAHAHSDTDVYTVVDSLRSRKKNGVVCKITGDMDTKVIDLATFLRFADSGQPQALEMMFHPTPDVEGSLLHYYRANYRASVRQMESHYRNIINRLDLDSVKHRRHGLRLALNLIQARANNGRFNPILNDDDKARVIEWATDKQTYQDRLRDLLG